MVSTCKGLIELVKTKTFMTFAFLVMGVLGFGLSQATSTVPVDVCNGSLFPNSECITSPTYKQNCNELYKEYDYRCTYGSLYEPACDYNRPGNTFPNPDCSIDQGYLNTTSSSSSSSTTTTVDYCDTSVYEYPDFRCNTSPTYHTPCEEGYPEINIRCAGRSSEYDFDCDYIHNTYDYPNMLCQTERLYFNDQCTPDEFSTLCPTSPFFKYPCANYLSYYTSDTDQLRCPTSANYDANCDYNPLRNPSNTYPNAACPLDIGAGRMLRH
jgi:hypothetical protein